MFKTDIKLKILLGIMLILFIPLSAIPCPECGCWSQLLVFQKRSYLDIYASFPMKEKVIISGEYEVFLTAVQIAPESFELLVYAQNPKTRRPYIRSKNITISKTDMPAPVIQTTDDSMISEMRYIDPAPGSYEATIELEGDFNKVTATIPFQLGSSKPNIFYLAILSLSVIMAFVLSLIRRHKKTTL
ncbi:MAG: hypothetical protein HY811_02195 [Planctomycetes bacterium]|nr:hypothetical protein [Planctomycetota bacterium]